MGGCLLVFFRLGRESKKSGKKKRRIPFWFVTFFRLSWQQINSEKGQCCSLCVKLFSSCFHWESFFKLLIDIFRIVFSAAWLNGYLKNRKSANFCSFLYLIGLWRYKEILVRYIPRFSIWVWYNGGGGEIKATNPKCGIFSFQLFWTHISTNHSLFHLAASSHPWGSLYSAAPCGALNSKQHALLLRPYFFM